MYRDGADALVGRPARAVPGVGGGTAEVVQAVVTMLGDERLDFGAAQRHCLDDRPLRAVVRQKDHDGVVEFTGAVEVVDHSADVPVHPVHHGGVDLHVAGRDGALLVGHARPFGGAVGDHRVRLDVGWAQTQPRERRQPLLAQGVRTDVVAAVVRGDGFPWRVQRPVRRLEGQVGEEGPVLRALGAFAEIPQQRVGVSIRRVEVLPHRDVLIVFGEHRRRG